MTWTITGTQKVVWDPSLITTALWLDAADSLTVTTDGSNLVSNVNDKSGNGRSFTASSGARPTYSANALNGRAVFTLEGSQYLTSASSAATWNFMHNTNGCTFWIVGKAGNVSNPQAEYAYLGNNAGTSSNTGSLFSYGDVDFGGGKNNDLAVDFITRGFIGQPTAANVSTNNAFTPNAAFFVAVTRDPGNATASARSSIRMNGGAAITQNVSPNAASSSNATYALQIGAGGNNTSPVTGYISEVIITNTIASADTRQQVEGYLAHKWGLTANLPSDHPFKINAPMP